MSNPAPRRRSKLSAGNPLGNTPQVTEATQTGNASEVSKPGKATNTAKTVKAGKSTGPGQADKASNAPQVTEATQTGNASEVSKPGEAVEVGEAVREFDRMTLNFPVDLGGKIRGALMVDGFPRGITSLSEWVSEAMSVVIEELEVERGAPLPQIHSGGVPRGHNAIRREN